MQPGARPNVLAHALAMAEAGYHVAPCRILLKPDGKKSMQAGAASWQGMATTDPEVVRGWFGPGGRFAGWSYLVDTERSGIVVVDLDGPEGIAAWHELGCPTTMMSVRTRAGGYHGYYRADPERPMHNTTRAVADHVDTRGIGGLAFGPGSMVEDHPHQTYEIAGDRVLPVELLPTVPAAQMESAMLARGRARVVPDGGRTIQREQAYANLLASEREVLELPVGAGVNTAIWHLAMEAGQYGGAVGAQLDTVLAYVLDVVTRRFGEPDDDDLRAATRGVEQGMEKPWNFFTLRDLIGKDFNEAGQPLPGTVPVTAEQLTAYSSRLASPDQIAAEPRPPALVRGLIDAGSFGMIYGPGGSGKSFVALDLALNIACGRDWHGRRTAQAKVCFVAAEGRRSTGARTQAWREINGVREPEGSVMIYGQPVDLFGQVDPNDWAFFCEVVRASGFGVVIFDTYNRCTPGLNENDSKDTGVVVRRLAALAATGVTVIVVHHTAKEGAAPRGSASLEWATDWVLSVGKRDAEVTVTNYRQKDRTDGNKVADVVLVAAGPTDEEGEQAAAFVPSAGQPDRLPTDPLPDEEAALFPAMLDLGCPESAGRDKLNGYYRVAIGPAGHGFGDGDPRKALQQRWQIWFAAEGSQRIPDHENARKIREIWTNQGKSLPPGVQG
jgi:hypothetical protein